MANLWDNLDEDQRLKLVQTYVGQQGNKSNENVNRAREQLINNPELVARVAKDAGITDEDDSVVQDDEGENDIERNVGAAMEEEAGDNQATGGLSKSNIPPAEAGESMEDYINRLMSSQVGPNGPQMVENDNAGQRNKLTGREIAKQLPVPMVSSDPNAWTNDHFFMGTRPRAQAEGVVGSMSNTNKRR